MFLEKQYFIVVDIGMALELQQLVTGSTFSYGVEGILMFLTVFYNTNMWKESLLIPVP